VQSPDYLCKRDLLCKGKNPAILAAAGPYTKRMDAASYLLQLTITLAEGLARQPAEVCERHAGWLRAGQNADGGWAGREGGSDLYYTAFALRGLAVLDALTPEIATAAAGFLRSRLSGQAAVVDFFSLLYAAALVQLAGGPDVFAGSPADWTERVAATLETFRAPDGGYAKTPGGPAGSTYHTFLVALTYELLGAPLPEPERVLAFLQSRRREDGGFVEIGPMKRSGTNPTAAAVGAWEVLGGKPPADVASGVIDLLAGLVSPEGGLAANSRVPLGDLLSTFTGAWTLHRLGALDRLDRDEVLSYAASLEQPGGGFRGGLWDDRVDVEYTFYGLGVMGLLQA
jgi:geranylgeranyl transferase type-2 subunit beta